MHQFALQGLRVLSLAMGLSRLPGVLRIAYLLFLVPSPKTVYAEMFYPKSFQVNGNVEVGPSKVYFSLTQLMQH